MKNVSRLRRETGVERVSKLLVQRRTKLCIQAGYVFAKGRNFHSCFLTHATAFNSRPNNLPTTFHSTETTFDTVDNDILLEKLFSIQGTALDWFLSNRPLAQVCTRRPSLTQRAFQYHRSLGSIYTVYVYVDSTC